MTTSNYSAKRNALADHLSCAVEDISVAAPLSLADMETRWTVGAEEFLVLTDSEADRFTAEAISESLWAFNASFLLEFIGCHERGADKAFSRLQDTLCEDANPLVAAMIGPHRMEAFVEKVTTLDGRGHFLAAWDGAERKHGGYYIYRVS